VYYVFRPHAIMSTLATAARALILVGINALFPSVRADSAVSLDMSCFVFFSPYFPSQISCSCCLSFLYGMRKAKQNKAKHSPMLLRPKDQAEPKLFCPAAISTHGYSG
jgi:hypothetical protein